MEVVEEESDHEEVEVIVFNVGDIVEALKQGGGYGVAKVAEVTADDTYTVAYDDSATEAGVHANMMRRALPKVRSLISSSKLS